MYKALLVDDEYMILKGLKKIIDWEKLNVEIVGEASNGKQALDFVETHAVDIVVTDITMPVLSGIDFIYEARNRGLTFEFIVLSGYEEFEYAQKSVQLGASNYLLKPIDKGELELSVKEVVEKLELKVSNEDMSARYYNQLLLNWLQGNETYSNVKSYLIRENLDPISTPFTLVFFKLENQINLDEWMSLTKPHSNRFILRSNAQEGYIKLPETTEESVREVLESLCKEVEGKVQLFASSAVTDLDNIEQYTNELSISKCIHHFYAFPERIVLQSDFETVKAPLYTQQHLFLQSILSREISVIKRDAKAFSELLIETKTYPEEAKQLSINLLTQSYLIFDSLDSSSYSETIGNIHSSNSYEELKNILTNNLIPVKELSKNLLYSDTTRQVISIVQKYFSSDLKLKDVSSMIHINTMYLGQLFKKETGKSFSSYLNDYRMDIAKQKLLQTNDSITSISEQIGYQNHGYFYKLFKNKYKQSPKEYRDEFKQSLENLTK